MDSPADNGDITEQLRRAITQSGLALAEIARRCGVDHTRLSRFVRRERRLTFESAAAVCKALGLSLVKTQTEAPESESPPPPAPEQTPTEPVPEPQAEAPQPRARRKRARVILSCPSTSRRDLVRRTAPIVLRNPKTVTRTGFGILRITRRAFGRTVHSPRHGTNVRSSNRVWESPT